MTHPIDKQVGTRIRQGRWIKGTTQAQLGDAVGCKFQQIQKYETGANRVSASRLWDISAALSLPVTYFFEDMKQPDQLAYAMPDRASAELLRITMSLPEEQREALLSLAKSMSSQDES